MNPEITQVPMIFTTRGNVPISSVKEMVIWQETKDARICVIEHHAEDGEIIKRSVHALAKLGLEALGAQPTL